LQELKSNLNSLRLLSHVVNLLRKDQQTIDVSNMNHPKMIQRWTFSISKQKGQQIFYLAILHKYIFLMVLSN